NMTTRDTGRYQISLDQPMNADEAGDKGPAFVDRKTIGVAPQFDPANTTSLMAVALQRWREAWQNSLFALAQFTSVPVSKPRFRRRRFALTRRKSVSVIPLVRKACNEVIEEKEKLALDAPVAGLYIICCGPDTACGPCDEIARVAAIKRTGLCGSRLVMVQ
ncbi:hypothetical protein BaRGS_00033657, partial [Batillaria attramentaria]